MMFKKADLEKMSLDEAAAHLAAAYIGTRDKVAVDPVAPATTAASVAGGAPQANPGLGTAGRNALVGAGLGAFAGAAPSMLGWRKRKNMLRDGMMGAGLGALGGGLGTMLANSAGQALPPVDPPKDPRADGGKMMTNVINNVLIPEAAAGAKHYAVDAPLAMAGGLGQVAQNATVNLPGNVARTAQRLEAASHAGEDQGVPLYDQGLGPGGVGDTINRAAYEQGQNFLNGVRYLGGSPIRGLIGGYAFDGRQQ